MSLKYNNTGIEDEELYSVKDHKKQLFFHRKDKVIQNIDIKFKEVIEVIFKCKRYYYKDSLMLDYFEKLKPKGIDENTIQKKIFCIIEGDLEFRYVTKIFKLFGYTKGCYPLSEEFIKIAWGIPTSKEENIVSHKCNFQGGGRSGAKVPFPAIQAFELFNRDLTIFESVIVFFDGDKDKNNEVENYFKEAFKALELTNTLLVSQPCFESSLIDFCTCGSCRSDMNSREELKYPCDKYKVNFSKLHCFNEAKNFITNANIANIQHIKTEAYQLNETTQIIQEFLMPKEIILWLENNAIPYTQIVIASADASFRSYYRLYDGNQSFIVMDSSLQKESLLPFIDISNRLESVAVNVPTIYKESLDDGFLLLEDLGSRDLLDSLDENNFEVYYTKAIDEIVKIQEANTVDLLPYDAEFLRFEMELMQEWYLEQHLGVVLDEESKGIIERAIALIVDEVLVQPKGVFVHRDFHSRNIMLRADDSLAVIDYQDARVGAITYDLVSLLRDCYISFDREKIEALALRFRDKKGLSVDDTTFIRWFDFMGLQRHIKILGIFARLSIRDGKRRYLDDLPLTLQYILEIASKYAKMQPLKQLLA